MQPNELHERTPLRLAPDVEVTRYPTAGIDNMLHVRAHGWSILNYNDCNLRPAALAALGVFLFYWSKTENGQEKLDAVRMRVCMVTRLRLDARLFAILAADHQLQVAHHALQRVVQLVRDAGHQLTDGGEPLAVNQLLAQAALFRDVALD